MYDDLSSERLYELIDHYLDSGGEMNRNDWRLFDDIGSRPVGTDPEVQAVLAEMANRLFNKYLVVREYSHTDRRCLYKVLSRKMSTLRDAVGWMDFERGQENAKGKDFMVLKIVSVREG